MAEHLEKTVVNEAKGERWFYDGGGGACGVAAGAMTVLSLILREIPG